jgi:hypothetical protein
MRNIFVAYAAMAIAGYMFATGMLRLVGQIPSGDHETLWVILDFVTAAINIQTLIFATLSSIREHASPPTSPSE